MQPRTKKILKISGIVFGVIIAIALGVVVWFAQKYKHIVKENLPKWVAESTDSMYKISVKTIRINVFTNSITVKGIDLRPDDNRINELKKQSKQPGVTYKIKVPKIHIAGIRWDEIIASGSIGCNTIYVTQPDVTITHAHKGDSVKQEKKKGGNITDLFAGQLVLDQTNITYINIVKPDTSKIVFKGGAIQLSGWEYQPGKAIDTTKFLLANSGSIYFDSITYRPGKLYAYTTGKTGFSSKDKRITIRDLKIAPRVDKETYYDIIGQEGDIYNADFASVEASGLNWPKLFNDQELFINNLYINNAGLDIYHSRLYAANMESKMGKFPHQMLQKLKLPININNLNINNGTVKYTEVNKDTRMAGTITFGGVDGEIRNITNMERFWAINDTCTIDLNGKFNEYSNMSAVFKLKLSDSHGAFELQGKLSGLEAYQINKQSKALAKLDIRSLHLRDFDMNIKGDESYAMGHFTMIYNGLKIKILDIDKQSQEVKNKGFLSFIANNVFVYTHNPMPGEDIRRVTTYVVRDERKSFFNLIWRNIYNGMLKTAIRDPNILDMLNKQNNKPKKQKGALKEIFKKNKKN